MFKVGDKVTSPAFSGVREVVKIFPENMTFPLKVYGGYSFTLDGRHSLDQPVSLFHVKGNIMGKITITIQEPKYLEITEAEQRLILSLVRNKTQAIVFMRNQYDLPLIEAKRLCDAVWESN